jgi:DNA-binding beta-propeller fold protein YncE
MTAGPWQAVSGGAVALTLAALVAGCGGGDGSGRRNDGATSKPSSSSGAADATTPTAAPLPQPGVLRSLAAWAGAPDPGGAGYLDGKGSAARLAQPTGVAAAGDGSYWVVEADGTRVRRIDAGGSVTTLFDAQTERLGFSVDGRQVLLTRPHALAAAPTGALLGAKHELRLNPDGSAAEGGPLAVVRVVSGEPVQLVVPPDPAHGLSPASAMAVDRQGRLYIAMGCGIWRTEGDVVADARPRSLQRVYPATASACGFESLTKGVTRLAVDAEDRVVFTLSGGEVLRLETDLRVTTRGRTSAGAGFACSGMVVDRQGGLLINGEKAVLRLDASGREQVVAGSPQLGGWVDGSPETARFGAICGMAIDGQGRVVLVDHDNHNLRRGEPDGRVITLAGLALQEGQRDGIGPAALFGRYFRISPGSGDEVLITDFWDSTVRSVDARQRVSTLVGAPRMPGDYSSPGSDGPVATARLYSPSQALRTADGSLWISDWDRVRRLGTDGIVRSVGTKPELENTLAMTLDNAGDVIVAWGGFAVGLEGPGFTFQHLQRYSTRTPDAAPVRMALIPSPLTERAGLIRSLCALPDGSLVYSAAHAVLRRVADGTVELLAGSPEEARHVDGPAASARFSEPAGLACDATGGIYVADSGNHTVRYIDAQRRVRTVLGTPGRPGHRFDALPGELHSPRSLALVPGGLVVATGMGLVRAGF